MKIQTTLIFLLVLSVLLSCNSKSDKNKNDLPDNQNNETSMITLLNNRIKNDSGNALLYNERASLYLEKKNINKALADINKAIQINDQNPEFYISLADIYLKMGNGKKCENALIKAKNINPENTRSLLKLGEINFILKDYKEAIKYLNQAIETDRDNSIAYLIKGYAYLEGGDTSRAISNFRTSYNNNQENYDAVIQLALIFSSINQPIAKDYFKNAIRINPKSIEAWYGLGMFYQNRYDVDNALTVYDTLMNIAPEFKNAYYNSGYVHMVMLNEFEDAIAYFTKAIEIDPDYAQAYYNRGFCYENLNMIEDAIRDYEKSLDLKTNYQIAIEALNRLADRTPSKN